MNHSDLCLKPIHELLTDEQGNPTRFWIPAYQRGYRWKPLQVTQLLEDVREFSRRRNPQPEDFYCLQPLVIKATAQGQLEVVDGQQRLTTLLLILRHFNERLAEKYRQKLFTLNYETRPELLAFLEDPNEADADSNVDYFYLFNALKTIEDWFSSRAHEVDEIKTALLNKTRVIWFELDAQDNAVDAFTRLNVGKIALTDDELIRALFLKRGDCTEPDTAARQLKIAHEWDQLEKALQADEFWFFLSNQQGRTQNRIGLLFDLVAKADGLGNEAGQDEHGVFHAYSRKLKESGATSKEWLRIKQTFMMLEEWFEDRTLYHIVGFLIHHGMDVADICKLSQQTTKSAFERKLRKEVFARTVGDEDLDTLKPEALHLCISERLKELEYGRHSPAIRSLLLLFNLATLLDSPRSNLRFQFDSFKNGEWDIEHVRSIASSRPLRLHDQLSWLNLCAGYLEALRPEEKAGLASQLLSGIQAFIKQSKKSHSDEAFEALYNKLLAFFQETDEAPTDHRICNLALLDKATNRSYKNAVFAVKRKALLALDQSGIFVPLCTRNVFLKCYSPQADNVMVWSKDDRDAYQAEINRALVGFFSATQEITR
ncbi:MAG: GmrSD restriction endonuclease domain-containing protein [Pseudomonas putida]